MCAIATVNEKEPVLGTQTLKVIHYLLYQVKCTTFSTISKGGNFTMLTKSEFIDLTATGRKQSTIKLYITIIKKFFAETGLNYHTCTGQDVMDYIATRLHKDKISKAYASTIQKYMSSFFAWAYRKKHIDDDVSRDIERKYNMYVA